jgi:peroxiredoxin
MTRCERFTGLFLPLAILLCACSTARPAGTTAAALNARVADSGSLRDLHGNRRALHDFKNRTAIVLAFMGTECPVGNVYLPRLIELDKRFRAQKVQFLAVYPNEPEDLDAIAAHAYDHDLPFPVLKDFDQKLADSLGVRCVPTVVVLDGDFALRYRGRIDDRYGVAGRRAKATRDDLSEALAEVLAGKKVSVPETEADGCALERPQKRPAKAGVTYARDVAPIVQRRCQACHRPEQSAPFALMSYDDAVKHARMIKEVTTQRRMPPWSADPRYGHFANERRLTRAEIDTLAAWVDGGLVRGDDRDLPQPIDWPKGWVHGKPDVVFTMPVEYEVPADGVLPYKNWTIDTHFTEDKWVQIAEARPGSPAVVHHVVAYIMKPGQRGSTGSDGSLNILVGWAPGDLGLVCPPDTALRVPAGARLRLELHYTPNGKVTRDRSSVGITFASKPPKYELLINELANMSFEIPPNDPHYRADACFRVRADARLISFAPHMHWRGRDFYYEIIYPDGKRAPLLSVPRWDFNWQNVYRFEEPLKLPKGARLHAVAHWDNSSSNPLNPDPAKSARFGLQTWEEMMVGFVAYVYERPDTIAELARHPLTPADQMFDRLDVNGDELITPDEVPARLRPFLLVSGLKTPDKISRDDFHNLYDDMRKRMAKGRAQGGSSGDVRKTENKSDSLKPKP